MRIATFNVENLFDRGKALDSVGWSVGRPALETHARLSALLEERGYTTTTKDEIVELLAVLELTRDDEGPFALLRQNRGRVFSRGCPDYQFHTPSGERLVLLVNHLTSKGFGRQPDNDARRLRQATRVAERYRRLRADGVRFVAVVGDLNDTPDGEPLRPLLDRTGLVDGVQHENLTPDPNGRPGTFGNGTASQKIDYVLLSPALFERVTGGLIFRKGVWGGTKGTLFPHHDTMTAAVHAASGHAALYADVDLG